MDHCPQFEVLHTEKKSKILVNMGQQKRSLICGACSSKNRDVVIMWLAFTTLVTVFQTVM